MGLCSHKVKMAKDFLEPPEVGRGREFFFGGFRGGMALPSP